MLNDARHAYRCHAGRALAIEALEPRVLRSAAVMPLSATAAVRAQQSYAAMQQYFARNDGTSLYHERYPVQSGDNPYSYLWPLSQAYTATIDMANLGGYQADVGDRVTALSHYYSARGRSPNAGVSPTQASLAGFDSYVDPPLGGSGDKYYDDNAWVGLASVQQYVQTGDATALTRAEGIFSLLVSGWDTNTSHPDPGGVFWTQGSLSQDRNTVSTMPAAEIGLRLYQITRNPFYFSWAQRMYNWVYTYVRDPSDGLYWDHINLAGQINKAKWSYNQGVPIGVNVLLYQVTGNPTYLTRAEQIASATLSHFGNSGLLQQPVAFDAIFFRNLLMLYRVDQRPAYASAIVSYGDSVWNSDRDASTALFRFNGSTSTDLLDQAAMTQVYALLATTNIASVATVTNALDAGPGSLRGAIQDTTASVIRFNIPTTDPNYHAVSGSWTVRLSSPIEVGRDVTIGGPGARLLTIDGGGAGRDLEIDANATAEIDGLTITRGGIDNHGTALLANDAVLANAGGAITSSGVLSIYSSTLSGNSAVGGSGGAIDNFGALNLVNSTLANNTADRGGAIFDTGMATLTNDTIAYNTGSAGGGILISAGDVTLYNTIVADNASSDIDGTLDAALAVGQLASADNVIGGIGSLGPLGNYGGPTQTIALPAASLALHAGSVAMAADAGISFDERHLARTTGGTIDIGAYESQPPTVAGDVNHDGTVNFADLLLLAQQYGSTSVPLFESGDLDGDGKVSFADLLILAQNYR